MTGYTYLLIIIAILAIVALYREAGNQTRAKRAAETYYSNNNNNLKSFVNTVQTLTPEAPKQQLAQTGLSGEALLYSDKLFQGSTAPLKKGEEVEFLLQKPAAGPLGAAMRVWKYRSLKKDARQVLKLTAYVQKTETLPEQRLVVYAEPRYGNVADLEAYLNEDPALKKPDGLAFDTQFERPVLYTVAIV